MTRTTPEWIGKTDDTPVPPRVRLRVFEKYGGVCQICTVKIRDKRWICDHALAIILGGYNRERNLQPIHEECDRKIKTPFDVAQKRINNRVRSKHLGIKKRKGRPMPGSRDSGIKMKIGGGWERR
jgi:5-methylcytosine-specific restriction endonuclease McrA